MDNLMRLRLKYEDSVGTCDVCNRRGLIGSTLKLFDDPQEAGVEREREDAEFYLRCADRQNCKSIVEDVLNHLRYSSADTR